MLEFIVVRYVRSSSNILVFINEQRSTLTLFDSCKSTGSVAFVTDGIETVHRPTTKTAKVFSCGLFLSVEAGRPTTQELQSGMGLCFQFKSAASVTPQTSITSARTPAASRTSAQSVVFSERIQESFEIRDPRTGRIIEVSESETLTVKLGADSTTTGTANGYSIGQYSVRVADKTLSNAVAALKDATPQSAQNAAASTTSAASATVTVAGATVAVRRQDKNGNTNYAVATMSATT